MSQTNVKTPLFGSSIARFTGAVLLLLLLAVSNALILEVQNLHGGSKDWQYFWSAGATVGTPNLLDPHKHIAWQAAHHLMAQAFVYPPAVAWFYVPASHLSLDTGLILNIVATLLLATIAGLIAAKIYPISGLVAVAAVLGWAPVLNAGFLGQHTVIALILSLVLILSLMRQWPLVAGLAVGLLLYKPQEALPFVVLLIVRREWRALAITGGCAVVWYFGSVIATAGDWAWPVHYLRMLQGYYHVDFIASAPRSLSLPGVLMYIGVPTAVAWGSGIALLLAGAVRLARAPVLEAASMTGLIGVAASPHAWPYDTVLLLPSFFYFMVTITKPWRIWVIGAAYAIAPLWVIAPMLRFNPLAIVVLGGTAMWLLQSYRPRVAV